MNRGKTLDDYTQYLPMSVEELNEAGVPMDTQLRIARLRTVYAHWVEYPTLSTKDMVEWECRMEKAAGRDVARSTAYADLQLVSIIIGNLQAANKDFMRWRVTKMLEEDRLAARRAGDFKSAVAAADKIAKYHQLDKPDTPDIDFEKIVPQQFVFTGDLSVLGIKPRKDLRKAIKKLNKELGRIEDADYEEVTDE